MRRPLSLGLLLCLCVSGWAADAPLKLLSTTRLTGPAAESLDLRWASEDELILAAGKKGVFRYDVRSTAATRLTNFFFAARLGVSRSYVVTSAPFQAIGWMRNATDGRMSPDSPFDVIVDLDVYGDTLAVLGAKRDKHGRWAPEGAIVWTGSLSNGLKEMKPLHYSEEGAGARPLDRCHFLNMGALRFLRDGTLLVVPGVEQGMYLYDRDGKLLQTWDTHGQGFQDRCTLTEDEGTRFAVDPGAKWRWLNAHTILDDVIPMPGGGAGLLLRQFSGGAMRWTFVQLRDGKPASRVALPITADERAYVRADVRGRQLALLIVEYQTKKQPDGARLAIFELPQ